MAQRDGDRWIEVGLLWSARAGARSSRNTRPTQQLAPGRKTARPSGGGAVVAHSRQVRAIAMACPGRLHQRWSAVGNRCEGEVRGRALQALFGRRLHCCQLQRGAVQCGLQHGILLLYTVALVTVPRSKVR